MKMQFFTIAIADAQAATDALNAFLVAHRVVHVERHFVADGANSAWSVCVSYTEGESRPAADRRPQKKVDYRDALSEPQFAVFAKLRTLRKTLADQEGVPAYALFTNEQLAEMVRRPVRSLDHLAGIDGVGQARVEKYGEAFLGILNASLPALTNGRARQLARSRRTRYLRAKRHWERQYRTGAISPYALQRGFDAALAITAHADAAAWRRRQVLAFSSALWYEDV